MGDYGFPPIRQPSSGDDLQWTDEYDRFIKEFQTEQPGLFWAANNWSFDSPTTPEPFLNDLAVPPQSPQQPTTNLPSLQRSNSKRPRGDDEASPDHKGKRNRKIENGFPCEEENCDKRFDRACDLSKHHKRVHTSKENRPHQCPKCQCRFCWPKDVKRHLAQVHSVDTEQQQNSLAIRGGPTHGLSLVIKQEPQNMDVDMTVPASATPKSPTMAWLTRSLVMLKKLRLRSKSVDESDADENFIFVTQDKRNFQMVDLNGVNSADSLTKQIANTFNLQGQIQSGNFLLHRFRKGSRLGEPLAGENLMAAITKAERAKRTLKLFLTLKSGPQQPTTSFFGGMPSTASPGSTFG